MSRVPSHGGLWPLFDPPLRWSTLPPDTRQRVVELLAQLLRQQLEPEQHEPADGPSRSPVTQPQE